MEVDANGPTPATGSEKLKSLLIEADEIDAVYPDKAAELYKRVIFDGNSCVSSDCLILSETEEDALKQKEIAIKKLGDLYARNRYHFSRCFVFIVAAEWMIYELF